jgi:hypothetical protein
MDAWRNLIVLEEAEWERQHGKRNRMRERRKAIRMATDPFDDMTTKDFVKLYRLPQHIVRTLIEDIRNDMPPTERQSAISVESKVCLLETRH